MLKLLVRSILCLIIICSQYAIADFDINDEKYLTEYYPFDRDAKDWSGSNNKGKLRGDASFKEGKIGIALYLDGDDDYVDLKKRIDLSRSFSVNFWIKPFSKGGVIFEKSKPGQLDASYEFYLSSSNRVSAYITETDYKPNGNWKLVRSRKSIPQNKWSNITYVVNRLSNSLFIYVNGKLDIHATRIPENIGNNKEENTIGATVNSSSEFHGYIDELRVYNSALSDDNIERLANDTLCPGGLDDCSTYTPPSRKKGYIYTVIKSPFDGLSDVKKVDVLVSWGGDRKKHKTDIKAPLDIGLHFCGEKRGIVVRVKHKKSEKRSLNISTSGDILMKPRQFEKKSVPAQWNSECYKKVKM